MLELICETNLSFSLGLNKSSLLAESTPNQIYATVKDHNKANPGFATAINSEKASFLHAYAQMWRSYKYSGMPMDLNAVINPILLILVFMISKAC